MTNRTPVELNVRVAVRYGAELVKDDHETTVRKDSLTELVDYLNDYYLNDGYILVQAFREEGQVVVM